MRSGAAPLLERYCVFQSRSAEEVHAFLRGREFLLDINPRRAAELDTRMNGVYLPGMWLGYIQYGAPVAVRAIHRDDYWVQIPVRGPVEVVGAYGSVICDARRGAVASPTHSDFYLQRSGSSGGGIRLCLNTTCLMGHLAAMLGDQPGRAPEFALEMDLTSGCGLSLARYVLMAIADLEGSNAMLGNPIVVSSFEQFVMTRLLLSHPHDYSSALRRLEKPIAPRQVRRAIDYIEAHLNTSFTIADIVQATGVAGRTLFKQFKDFKGISPMRYARNARFQQVQRALLGAEPEEGVTAIAMSCGFTHMGRFSIEYRQRFGERPSETLKRRKRSRSALKKA